MFRVSLPLFVLAAIVAVQPLSYGADSTLNNNAAPTATPDIPQNGVQADLPDRQAGRDHVLTDLHHSNQMEIEMGKLAQKQGKSVGIKKYGETLERDHKDADKKVIELSKTLGIKLPNSDMPAGKESDQMASLKSLKGAAFDRAFANAMVQDHEKAITNLRAALTTLNGTPVGELVAAVLPVLEEHKRIATELSTQLKS